MIFLKEIPFIPLSLDILRRILRGLSLRLSPDPLDPRADPLDQRGKLVLRRFGRKADADRGIGVPITDAERRKDPALFSAGAGGAARHVNFALL